MAACKLEIVIPENHRVELKLPPNLPPGRAMVTVEALGDPPDSRVETSISATDQQRRDMMGIDAGKIWIADDFDAPLPDDLQRLFEGGD